MIKQLNQLHACDQVMPWPEGYFAFTKAKVNTREENDQRAKAGRKRLWCSSIVSQINPFMTEAVII